MKADAVSLLAIFEKKMRLEVPLFQRQYVWGREQEWEPLWEDIVRKFSEHLEGRKDAPVHFLGAMVFDQKQTPTTHVEKRQVIDGQQRLTTFQIFLAVFRDFCREQTCEEIAKECDGFTLNRGMMAEPAVDKFKVWPTQLDRSQYADVLTAGSREEIEKKHPLQWKKWARRPEPRPRMVEAYVFFHDQLSEFFLGSTREKPIASDIPVDARLEECFQALKNSLRVVVIDLEKDDDAQVIFETLNARGAPLLPADLLRNFIFLRAARASEPQEELYEKFWSKFDDEFWRVEVKQGRLLRPRSDLFMQHFLSSRLCEDVPIKHLFIEYKYWIDRKAPFASVRDELACLSRSGDDFRRIIDPKKGDNVYRLARFLDAFDIRTAYPFLIAALEQDLPKESWTKISGVIESYLLRRAVCGMSTKNYNRVFLSLTKSVRREGLTVENVAKHLAGQLGESVEWPSDPEFKYAWLNGNAYDLGNSKLVHIFSRLADTYMNAKAEPILFENQPTIEHILPQNWVKHWPLQGGELGLESWDLNNADDADPRALASRSRKKVLQTFGNLTILTQALNSAQSNSPWREKRPELMRHSLLPINQELCGVEAWDEDSIASRSEELFERAKLIWVKPPV